MKKGFTLVELLAVIVILSVVGVITIPLIGDVIEESRKKALEQSAYGLVETANYLALNNNGLEHFTFTREGVTSATENKLDYKGKIDAVGDLYIDEEGNISLCLTNDKYYVYKSYNTEIRVGERKVGTEEEDNCRIKTVNGKYIAYLESDTSSNYVTQGELASIIGDMSTLGVSETNRDNVVSAMNEIYNSVEAIKTIIGTTEDAITSTLAESIEDLQNQLSSLMQNPSDEDYIIPTFVAATNGGGTYYMKIGNRVRVKIYAKNLADKTNTTIFTLPVGYRPKYVESVIAAGYDINSRGSITVKPDGSVVIQTESRELSGNIEFYAYQ